MLLLAIGIVLFLGIHLVPTSPELRNGLVARFGEPAYKVGFALLSLLGLVVIVLGYHKKRPSAQGATPSMAVKACASYSDRWRTDTWREVRRRAREYKPSERH